METALKSLKHYKRHYFVQNIRNVFIRGWWIEETLAIEKGVGCSVIIQKAWTRTVVRNVCGECYSPCTIKTPFVYSLKEKATKG